MGIASSESRTYWVYPMNKVPYLVDVMQQGDIIKKRYVVWLNADSACPKEARQFVQLNTLGKGIYDPEAGDTIVAELLDIEAPLWILW